MSFVLLLSIFRVSSLHQSEAYLLLVPQRGHIPRGSTMVFRLIGEATGLKSEVRRPLSRSFVQFKTNGAV